MAVQSITAAPDAEDADPPVGGVSWHGRVRLLVAFSTGLIVYLLAVWVREDPIGNLDTDWRAFVNTGNRLREGSELYRPIDIETEPLPWLYPPFALWLAWPLGFLGFWTSYLVSTLVPLAAYGVGLKLLADQTSASLKDKWTAVFVAVLSGGTIGATLIGQYSGFYVMFLAAGATLFIRGKHLLAGLVLSLLWLKPNIAIAVPVVLLWSRSWGTLRGFVAGTGGLFVASLPFGVGRWGEFLDSAQLMAELQEQGIVPLDKMVTFTAAVQETVGLEGTSASAVAVWLVVSLVTGLSVLATWRPTALEQRPLRAFGTLALFVVAANPRLYFYDALVAAAGMFAIWLDVREHSIAAVQRRVTALAGVMWIGLWGSVFLSLNVIVGPISAVTLVLVALDSRSTAGLREQPTSTDEPSTQNELVDVGAHRGDDHGQPLAA